ncbi:MAG: glycosyltransferase family 25 protein, partial [Actinobacteria bacterium]|nr:glycosyltransferase family 25 protein [Actinomycetota bacterium]
MKINYLQNHKFNICFENHSEPGYITEKLLHAKLAGCVPLYWGDVGAQIDFNKNSFINLTGKNLTQMMNTLKYYDEHPDESAKIASTPPLSSQDILTWYDKFKNIVKKTIKIIENSKKHQNTEFITQSPVFVTYFDSTTLNSKLRKDLKLGCQFLEKQRMHYPELKYVMYCPDNIDISSNSYLLSYPFVKCVPINLNKLTSKYNISNGEEYWQYNKYGWRLILLNEIVTSTDEILKNKTIIWTNPGTVYINIPDFFVKFPQESEEGCIFMRDPYVTNSQWCPQNIVDTLKLSVEDLSANFVFPEIIVLKNNNSIVKRFFSECLEIDSRLNIICNKTFVEISKNNEIIGNSHDTLLYSILLRKYKLPNIDFTEFVDRISMYSCVNNGKSIYFHSGKFLEIHRLFSNIDNIKIINLERRPDRLESLYKSFPTLTNFSNVFKATDGKQLEMTPDLKHLFRNNDFDWKKSVMGCALSHMRVWLKLVEDNLPFVNNYMILEDDVRFNISMLDTFANSMRDLPSDTWDVLYLGGVLPCNREIYGNVLEHVKGNWYKIKANSYFSKGEEINIFHHCLYSYVLSKRGAVKLLKMIEENGIWTSMDHLVMALNMKGGEIYSHYESVTYSYQEIDEEYMKT